METVTNKTLEKLKYDLVRAGLVQYETIEQAEEISDAQNINSGEALINSGVITEESLLKFYNNVSKKPKFMCIIVGNFSAIIKDEETGIYIIPITALKP